MAFGFANPMQSRMMPLSYRFMGGPQAPSLPQAQSVAPSLSSLMSGGQSGQGAQPSPVAGNPQPTPQATSAPNYLPAAPPSLDTTYLGAGMPSVGAGAAGAGAAGSAGATAGASGWASLISSILGAL